MKVYYTFILFERLTTGTTCWARAVWTISPPSPPATSPHPTLSTSTLSTQTLTSRHPRYIQFYSQIPFKGIVAGDYCDGCLFFSKRRFLWSHIVYKPPLPIYNWSKKLTRMRIWLHGMLKKFSSALPLSREQFSLFMWRYCMVAALAFEVLKEIQNSRQDFECARGALPRDTTAW